MNTHKSDNSVRYRIRRLRSAAFLLLCVFAFSASLWTAEPAVPEHVQERYEQGVNTLAKVPGVTNYAISEVRGPQITDPSLKTREAIEGEIKKGIRDLEWVLSEGYSPEGLYYFLGSAYAGLLKWDEAIKQYDLAIEKHPQFESAYTNLLAILWDQKRFDRTSSILDRYAQAFPDKVAPYHFLKGVDLQRKDEMAAALDEFQAAVDANPDMIEARIALGSALLFQNRDDEAEPHFKAVLDKFPQLKPLVDQVKAQSKKMGHSKT